MKNIISNYEELKNSIEALEIRQNEEMAFIKNEFQNGLQQLNPIHMIKSTFLNKSHTSGIKESLLATTVGLVAGYVSKKLFIGMSHNPVKKVAGTLVLIAITNIVASHPEQVKRIGRTVIKLFGKLIGARPVSSYY
jgi:hypothetical protein